MAIEYKQMGSGRKKKWLPHRINLTNFNGEKSILDVGADAEVTVIIKGPYVNLEFNDVLSLTVDARSEE